jgi:hypothetical protein
MVRAALGGSSIRSRLVRLPSFKTTLAAGMRKATRAVAGSALIIEVLGGDKQRIGGGLFKGESLLTAQFQYNFNLL